jgi:putative hydrolase of the HAD superfamily
MRGTVLWDFDGTLATRPGLWSACLLEVLDEHEPGHRVAVDDLRTALRDGFPWHRPEVPHPELCAAGAWWAHVGGLLARAFAAAGYDDERAAQLAALTRELYVDATRGWRLFDDVLPALEGLSRLGWRHVILSNHVPELASIVSGLGLEPLVDAVVNSAVTGYEKPHPQAFALARAAAGDPRTVWMVGDSVSADVAGAEAAGIPAILVRTTADGVERRAETLLDVEPFLA